METHGMSSAPISRSRAVFFAACGLALLLAPRAQAQIINLSLNVYYENPSDTTSGGAWKLVARGTNFGIAGMNVRLTGISSQVMNEAPRGVVNGSDLAGFGVFEEIAGSYLITQQPAFPTGGEEESAFYGVGTIQNGEPGDVGPNLNSLTSEQDIPWATGDDFGESFWDVAATFLSGTFADNAQPGFGSGSSGRVFTTEGTSMEYGEADFANITTTIRTNFVAASGADYNDDGVIDAADYVVWRKNPAANGGDPAGYDEWREHFAEGVIGGSPASAAVPEPGAAILLLFALFSIAQTRPTRRNPPLAA
jgi:hypothetical protein